MQDAVDTSLQFIRVAGSLALVLALLFAVLYGLRKLKRFSGKSGAESWIEVLAQHAFGPKHFLLVVKVQSQLFLLGISPQGMHFLAPLDGTPPPGSSSSDKEDKK